MLTANRIIGSVVILPETGKTGIVKSSWNSGYGVLHWVETDSGASGYFGAEDLRFINPDQRHETTGVRA